MTVHIIKKVPLAPFFVSLKSCRKDSSLSVLGGFVVQDTGYVIFCLVLSDIRQEL